MGIQGLLPFLKKIHQPVNISDFKGCTVAIDAYCWLHKGAFSCAEKLAMGEKTDQYVYYCMKYVDYILRKGLKPIMVFDGCHLKSKEEVEKTRRAKRELNRKKAAQFLREGKRGEAKDCLQKCVDITPQMALDLMNVCRDRGVDCIVAPYEADAQLAYLNLSGIAQIIVTEDSDLLLFGCDKVIFKMDFFGNGVLIEKSRLNEVLAIQNSGYNFEKFRYMCILSGCDYLPSLPGIGLAKACKVFKTARQHEIRLVLKKLPTYLKMNLAVTEDYIEGFVRADNTFLYQLVYDPLKRRLAPLNPYPPEIDTDNLEYAGKYLPEETAYQIALGNVDIHTHKFIAFFDPDTFKPKASKANHQYQHQLSIWDKNYRIKSSSGSPCKTIQPSATGSIVRAGGLRTTWQSTQGKTCPIGMALPQRGSEANEAGSSQTEPGALNEEEERLLMTQYEPEIDASNTGITESTKTSQKENIESSWSPLKAVKDPSPPHEEEGIDPVMKIEEKLSCTSPRKGKKRKHAPSWLAETEIETELPEHKAKEEGEEDDNTQCPTTPGKVKNIFAVSPAKTRIGHFNLDVHALKVQSRYFSCSKPEVSSSSSQLHTNATKPHKLDPSPKTKKKHDSSLSPKKRLLSMFANAPIKTKKEVEDVQPAKTQQESSKNGLDKYFYSKLERPDAVLTNAKSSDGESQPDISGVGKVFEASDLKPQISPSFPKNTATTSKRVASKHSPSSQLTNSSGSNVKSRLSAFSWSKSGSLSNVRLDKFLSPKAISEKERIEKLSESLSSTEEFEEKDAAVHKTKNKGLSEGCEVPVKRVKITEMDEGTSEVQEMETLDYSQFIQSLGSQKNETCRERVEGDTTEVDQKTVEGSESQGSKATELSYSQSSLTSISQRSSVGSMDSFCLNNTQDVVDLTDEDFDSQQESQVSSSSKASRQGLLTPPQRCRVSGLSRLSKIKVKPGVKKMGQASPNQPTIKAMMVSKYF